MFTVIKLLILLFLCLRKNKIYFKLFYKNIFVNTDILLYIRINKNSRYWLNN